MTVIEVLTILEGMSPRLIGEAGDTSLRDLRNDSRAVLKRDCFVALRGEAADGHRYLADAVTRGAGLLLVEQPLEESDVPQIVVPDTARALNTLAAPFYGFPYRDLTVIGVTGTNGKTTTTYILESLLTGVGRRPAVLGTINHRFGSFHQTAANTTPYPHTLHRFISQVKGMGADTLLMEVSSHGLALGRVMPDMFNFGIFTNLTEDHLDFHDDFEEYYAAKRLMFAYLRDVGGHAAVNTDDPYGRRLIADLPGLQADTYGINPDGEPDVRAQQLTLDRQGARFELNGRCLATGLLGRFNVMNILGALTCLRRYLSGESYRAALDHIPRIMPVKGRFQTVDNDRDIMIIIDYAHTPDALENVLQALREFDHRRLVTVFGCGGDRDRRKRPLMGEIAVRYSDTVYVTSDNPRTEDPEGIITDIMGGIGPDLTAAVEQVCDRREAIRTAVASARSGDIVLVAGKGHEDYQIIGREKRHFSDEEEVRAVFT
jgi:UDP-N-acetylmuramoyl-L-alanyl-D-glutamate--2,6-diaminopimelate ligase